MCYLILFICIAPFTNKIVSRCFTEAETQSRNPGGSTVARKNSLLTGRNLEQDPAYRVLPVSRVLLRVGRVKDKKERETRQREGEREKRKKTLNTNLIYMIHI